jgi:hypothetical protein
MNSAPSCAGGAVAKESTATDTFTRLENTDRTGRVTELRCCSETCCTSADDRYVERFAHT